MSEQKPTTAEVAAYLRDWHGPERFASCGCAACERATSNFAAAIEQLERVEALEAENARLRAQYEAAAVVTGNAFGMIAELREALAVYADEGNWSEADDDGTPRLYLWEVEGDGPELARRALAEIRGPEPLEAEELALLRKALDLARDEERRECIAALCYRCGRGEKVECDPLHGVWFHFSDDEIEEFECDAWLLHERAKEVARRALANEKPQAAKGVLHE